MPDFLENRVYALIAEQRGIDRNKLTPASTLSYDLGLEGDDAIEFFQKFRDQFAVDLSKLDEDWNQYFAPEGVSPLTFLITLGPGALLGFGFGRWFPGSPAWLCYCTGILLWFAPFFYFIRRRSKEHPQISIQDLFACAQAGSWTKIPPQRSA